MSLARCIPDMLARGEIDPARAKRMKDLFDELEAHYRQSMGPDAAVAEASEATLRQLRDEAVLKKRQTLLQINRQREAMADVERFTGDSRYDAVAALLDDDDRAPYRGGNVTTAAMRIEYGMHGRIADFIDRHSRTLLGKPRDPEGLDNVVRELHGQATGDARAKAGAEAIADAFEQLRQRFNAAGGNIRKLAGYGMSHRHDALKVRAVSQEQWVADVTAGLDRARMIDNRTGAPLTDERLSDVLGEMYETIRTNGLTGAPSSALRGAGKLANRRTEARQLHFRDGDAWLTYQAAYGAGDNPFAAIIGHINGMAKDIAMMERLGPNPDATMRLLLDQVDRTKAQSDELIVGAVAGKSGGRKWTEDLWRYVKGETGIPVVPERAAGRHTLRFVNGLRNWNVASMLGSSPISAISDVHSGVMARSFYGLPETKALAHYLNAFVPRTAETKALARKLGAGMEQATQSMAALSRIYGESQGPAWSSVLADSTLRVAGLNLWTAKGQEQFVTDFFGHLGDLRETGWDALPAKAREAMEKSGIDAGDWATVQASAPIMSGGRAYVDVQAIGDRGTANRVMDMALRGRAGAVIESSPSSRLAASLGTTAGTMEGEIVRNSLQFKGFAAALIFKQGRMMATLPPRARGAYAARFFIGMTVFGAAVIQLRELAKGNDLRPMDTLEFWADAALQGGGIGIAGDLIGAFAGDRIDGVGQFFGGPSASFVTDTVRAVKQSLPGKEREDGTRREANPGGAALRFAKRHLPGTNIWYMRAAFERLVIDQLDEELNPHFATDRARQAARREKNGQGAWWAPGDAVPERLPNVENALATPPE